jgi:hypothetical protein
MTEPIRVHLRVPGTGPVPELVTLIEHIEAAGIDGVGILDSQMTKLGVRNLYLMPLQTFVSYDQELRVLRDVVLPRLRAAGLH